MPDAQPLDVMILGCGRSGTSIFGELFESIPGYAYWSEPVLAELPAPPRGPLAVKVPRTTAGVTAPTGSPITSDELDATMPGGRVVFWQVRHPLDAISSLRVGIDQGWSHHPRPPDWTEWLERPLVERCAHHWATVNSAGYEMVRAEAVVNRFEEMVHDPRACAVTTMLTVGAPLPGTDDLGAVESWVARVQDTDNEHFVEARTSRRHSRPDHRHRVGRWRENLTPDEVAAVVPIVADAAANFGYELP